MDSHNNHDFSVPQLNSNDKDQVNVIDPFLSQSSYASNDSHFNPQTPIPSLSNPFLNNSNQFQGSYGFHPPNFTPHLQQQYSFQGLMNTPIFPFETQKPIPSKKNGRKQKNNQNLQTKYFEPPQPLRRNWTKEEDVALTKAWLHISIDPLVGKDQPSDKLWRRIYLTWKEFLGDDFVEDRPLTGLGKRWCTIQAAVNKFHGIYEQLARSPKSGTNSDDLKRDAYKVYKETSPDNKSFLFEHCWVECKKNAKWCTEQLTTNSSKRQRENSDEPIDVHSLGREAIDADGVVRPPGRTTSKEKRKMQLQDKGTVEILSKLQVSLEQQFNHNKEELKLKRENVLTMKKEYELREHTMKKELEFKEKELALKEKAQRRKDQQKILNQDLSKLNPAAREVMENMQERILKEWSEEDFAI